MEQTTVIIIIIIIIIKNRPRYLYNVVSKPVFLIDFHFQYICSNAVT